MKSVDDPIHSFLLSRKNQPRAAPYYDLCAHDPSWFNIKPNTAK